MFAFNKELMDAQTEAEVLKVLDDYKSRIGLKGAYVGNLERQDATSTAIY